MGGHWGTRVDIQIFGESHGRGLGIVIAGLPAGESADMAEVARQMARRAPGNEISTARREPDQVEIISGIKDGVTTGSPICGMILNTDARTQDYRAMQTSPRPGHADFTAHARYEGHADMAGGGHFSGRITASLVLAGALTRQYLARRRIVIGGHVASIGGIADRRFETMGADVADFARLYAMDLPVLEEAKGTDMRQLILEAKEEGDSVGGVVEVMACHLPVGLGEPFFDSLESQISHLLFSIPAVKGVEFGDGFALTTMRGSKANDAYKNCDGSPCLATNHCGGALGGLSSGTPLIVRVAFKPTPSIALPQDSVTFADGSASRISVPGRHDPCVVPRAVVVVESVVAMALTDAWLCRYGEKG
jgi:chorismate synthase